MKPPLRQLVIVGIALAALAARAADAGVIYSLIAPATLAEAGTTIEVQIAAMNRSPGELVVQFPATLAAALVIEGKRSEITLRSNDPSRAVNQAIGAGAFSLRAYAASIPAGAGAGHATLEVQLTGFGTVRTALEITPPTRSSRDDGTTPTQRPTTTLVGAQPAASALRRIFADRVAPHEPVYFIYGADDPAAKFQFSFKYKLLDFQKIAPQRMARTLHFAFTQRSLWAINEDSSPFYDTSYMPELIYQSLAPASEERDRLFTWLGFQAAFKHESNGRDGATSRSLNIMYARTVLAFGRLDGWHLLAIPEVVGYLSSQDENEDIEDYRGYGKLHLVIGRNDGPSLVATLWAGKDLDQFSTQLDLTFPVRTRLLNFETYFLVQYFNGYGESLLSYREHSETIRAGISLVR